MNEMDHSFLRKKCANFLILPGIPRKSAACKNAKLVRNEFGANYEKIAFKNIAHIHSKNCARAYIN